jgi:alcohol dehydrogenase class IV
MGEEYDVWAPFPAGTDPENTAPAPSGPTTAVDKRALPRILYTQMTTVASVAVGIWPKRLILGEGSMAQLGALLDDLGAHRALVLCGRTVASGDLLTMTRNALGDRFAGVFDRVGSHTPLTMVEEITSALASSGADAVVTVGGGSAIDAGKGVMLLRTAGTQLDPYAVRYDADGRMSQRRLPAPDLVHVAIPTTSGSASEVMPTAGIRDVAARKKLLFWDDALIPQGVILDPVMVAPTNAFLSAASGMTAVARCVESLFSMHRNAIAEALALHALRLLQRNLPIVVREPGNLAARHACQVACSMSGTAAINSMVSIVHALGHVVGGKYGLQHGVSHAIMLAPAMRRMLPVIGDAQHLVLEALGGQPVPDADEAGRRAADRVAALLAQLPLKARLRDIGLTEDELPDLAEQTTHDYMMINLPRPMDTAEIEALLRSVW